VLVTGLDLIYLNLSNCIGKNEDFSN